jgi:hypothetical protein
MSKNSVRHEVVAVIVVRRKMGDTTRCPISGILRRCAGRSRPVQSLRTMSPQSRTGIETVRPRCLCQPQDGAGAGRSGMAHPCERAIHIVNDNQPKGLEGLSQTWQRSGDKDWRFPCHGPSTLPVESARLTHSLVPATAHGNPGCLPEGKASRKASPWMCGHERMATAKATR